MAITRSGNDPLNYLNSLRKPEPANQSQYRGVNANSTGGARNSPGMLGQVQGLSQTPRQNSGFSMDGPRQVSASVPPIGTSAPRVQSAPAARSYVSPGTERASQSFNREAAGLNQSFNDRMGYASPSVRQSGFFQRGMGSLASDAQIPTRQSQPLGDGGLPGYAARMDQMRRQREANELMGGASPDGLARYVPNRDVMSFANQDRAASDQRSSDALGGGTQYRQPMQAMTPAEIQFYRHKMGMASNPQYANRVNQQRADRQEMLDNRRDMVRARRAGALEAAGTSQQLRNLYAGRGGIGPGMDGVGALMSMGAQQDPAATMGAYGNVLRAQDAPLMQLMNYGNQAAMFDRQAQLERDLMDRATKMAIYSSGMSGPEIDLAMQRFNAANNGTPITSPLHAAGDFQVDPSKSPMDNYLAIQEYFDNVKKTGAKITPEQERQIMMAKGINPSESDLAQWRQDSKSFYDTADEYQNAGDYSAMTPIGEHYIVNPLMNWLGLGPGDQARRKRMRERLQR